MRTIQRKLGNNYCQNLKGIKTFDCESVKQKIVSCKYLAYGCSFVGKLSSARNSYFQTY